jgi:hypothetical protein
MDFEDTVWNTDRTSDEPPEAFWNEHGATVYFHARVSQSEDPFPFRPEACGRPFTQRRGVWVRDGDQIGVTRSAKP